jgi:hypothetical protein
MAFYLTPTGSSPADVPNSRIRLDAGALQYEMWEGHDVGLPLLWRLACSDGLRARAACNGGWREDRQIGVAAAESIEAYLTIPYGCKLTSQDTGRRAVLGRRPESIDNSDARARLERWHEVVK